MWGRPSIGLQLKILRPTFVMPLPKYDPIQCTNGRKFADLGMVAKCAPKGTVRSSGCFKHTTNESL